jgi:cytochrome c peroxidase
MRPPSRFTVARVRALRALWASNVRAAKNSRSVHSSYATHRLALEAYPSSLRQHLRRSSEGHGPTWVASAVVAGGFTLAALCCSDRAQAETAKAETAQAAARQPSREEVAAVRAAINEILDEDTDLAAAFVGLAWAASGSFDRGEGIGGSDDVASLTRCAADPDLSVPLDALKRVVELFPEWSAGDIWTFAGAVAIEHMGGPPVHWRPGRRSVALGEGDSDIGVGTGGVLFSNAIPKASAHPNGIGDTVRNVKEVFARQGFSDRELVALLGAYAVCRCHPSHTADLPYSGVVLTRAPAAFGNEYFRFLLSNTWTLRRGDGPDQFENVAGDLVILPADMALLLDKDLRKHVETFAKDEDAFYGAFASAFQKLEENGVSVLAHNPEKRPWYQFW